jgi:hypothetical protein
MGQASKFCYECVRDLNEAFLRIGQFDKNCLAQDETLPQTSDVHQQYHRYEWPEISFLVRVRNPRALHVGRGHWLCR